MPQNQIPGHPMANAAQAAAGRVPVQVHQGAPAGIPAHPGVAVAQAQAMQAPPVIPAAQPQANPMVDFFAQTAFEADADFSPEPEPGVPGGPQNPQPSTDLVNIDDLLSGGEFPQEPAPVPQPQAQPQPQQQPQALQQPQVQPVQQPQVAPPQAPAEPSPEQLMSNAIDYLRDNVYKFDDETSRRALTEPEVVLPQLAARLHVTLINEFAQQMHRALPTLIEREVTRRTAVMETKNEFFRRYPRLNKPEYEPIVADSIAMAAQIHKGQTREKIMQEGAVLAAYRLRSMAPRPQPAQGRPAAFVPANPGGGGPIVPNNPQQPQNIWAELSADPDLLEF